MSAADRAIRISTALVVVALGAIAAVISYRHILDVAVTHGETGGSGALLPVCVDGMLFVSSMVMLDAARRGQRSPGLAKVALGLGIGATVAANVLHGIPHGPIGAVLAAWPAVTLVTVVELMMGMIRRGRTADSKLEISSLESAAIAEQPFKSAPKSAPTGAELNGGTEHSDPVVASARDHFAETLAAGTVPSVRAIRKELRVGHPRAVRIRAVLAET